MNGKPKIYKTVGDKLSSLRNDAGITQEQISSMLGIPQTTYAGYESGARKVPLDVLNSLYEMFRKPAGYVLEQGIYEPKTRAFIMQHMDKILEKMKKDYIGAEKHLYTDKNGQVVNNGIPLTFIELIEKSEPEMQFKMLSAFLMDVDFDEDTKEFGLIYYK